MKLEQFESIYSHQDFLWVRREEASEFTFIRPSDVKPLKPFDEAVRSAMLIAERSPDKKISLCLSGGMDSECMLLAYMAAGVKFEVAIMRFKDGLNAHDIESAEIFCRERNLTPQYIDLDIIKFYESGEFLEYAHLARTASPQLAVHAWLAMRTNYTPVFAGDFIYFHNLLIFFNEKPVSFKAPEYKDYAVDRMMKRHGRFGVSNFFNYSFEQLESFVTYTRAGRSANFDNTGMYSRYHFRCAVYRDAGFNYMTWPGRQKFSGFEQVKTYFAERTGDMDAYENIFRRPLEDVFGGPADNMFMFVKKGNESLFGNILRELSVNHAEEKRLGIVRVTP